MSFDLDGAPVADRSTTAAQQQRRVLLPNELPPAAHISLGGGHALRLVHTLAGATMGTYWRARLVERPTAHNDDAAEANAILTRTFDEIVARMSPWEPESDLARFARATPGEWVALAPETAYVLACALEVAALTGGAYSPALGEVTALLGFGPGAPNTTRPSIDSPQVRAARARADYRRLELDTARNAVRQHAEDTMALHIDLCSIAKGYAVDLASERLHAAGWHNHFIEIGGEARGRGCKPDGQPWWCHLETPHSVNHSPQSPDTPSVSDAVAGLCELAVASSGNTYHHFTETSGRTVGHILRPEDFAEAAATRAEVPAPASLHSVSVLTPTCMEADVWATALYALGPERGLPLAEAQGLAARWIIRDTSPTAPFREIATTHFFHLLTD